MFTRLWRSFPARLRRPGSGFPLGVFTPLQYRPISKILESEFYDFGYFKRLIIGNQGPVTGRAGRLPPLMSAPNKGQEMIERKFSVGNF